MNRSLKGIYAVSIFGTGGHSPEAGLGILEFDGGGRISGCHVQNRPAASFRERRIVKSRVEGSYEVDENYTGMGIICRTFPDGSTTRNNVDLVITRFTGEGASRVADRFSFIVRELADPAGCLLTAEASKLPGEGRFAPESFLGVFSFRGSDPASRDPAAGFGQITFDGEGKFTGFDILNVRNDGGSFGDRAIFPRDFEGSYRVDEDGIFTALMDNGDEAIFVATEARVVGGLQIAEEYFYVVPSKNLGTTGGFLIVSVGKKYPSGCEITNFSAASLSGKYAFKGTGLGGRSPVASLGVLRFDGKGGLVGTERLSRPGPTFRAREYEVRPIEGSYELEPRGTGVIRDKASGEEQARFLISQATADDSGDPTSLEITLLPLNPIEETGSLVLSVAKRLPDEGEFKLASLAGTFGFRGIGQGGQAPEAGVGTITFDGNGAGSAKDILNLPAPERGGRHVLRFPFNVIYSIDSDGFGTITQAQEGGVGATFVVTVAETEGRLKVAREISALIDGASNQGNLVRDLHTYLEH